MEQTIKENENGNNRVIQKAVVYDQMASVKKDSSAIAAFISGLLAFIFGFTIIAPLLCGIGGIIRSVLCLVKKKPYQGLAIAALILSILGLFEGIIMIVLYYIGIHL